MARRRKDRARSQARPRRRGSGDVPGRRSLRLARAGAGRAVDDRFLGPFLGSRRLVRCQDRDRGFWAPSGRDAGQEGTPRPRRRMGGRARPFSGRGRTALRDAGDHTPRPGGSGALPEGRGCLQARGALGGGCAGTAGTARPRRRGRSPGRSATVGPRARRPAPRRQDRRWIARRGGLRGARRARSSGGIARRQAVARRGGPVLLRPSARPGPAHRRRAAAQEHRPPEAALPQKGSPC